MCAGCWSAGLRAARSPGVTAPHFVTSNKLGEKLKRPKQSLSPDYDSLLSRVSGDFGIKSAIVRAAKNDPEYKGIETLVVPLYIPKGAVPIRLARIPRSGGGGTQTVAIRRPPSRRSRIPSITSRRKGGPRRPLHPTPPPSFLRGWGRRISPRADARIGIQSDSDTSESKTLESNLPELVRSKKNQNSKVIHASKTTPNDDDSSKIPSIRRTSTTVALPTLRIRRGSTPRPPLQTDGVISSSALNGVEHTSQAPTTDILFSNTTIKIPIYNLKSIPGSSSYPQHSKVSKTANKTSAEKPNNSSENVKSQRRPLPLPKPVKDILGHSLRSHRTSTTEAPKPDESDSQVPKENKYRLRSSGTTEKTTVSTRSHEDAKQPKPSSTTPKRRLPFPLRGSSTFSSSEKEEKEKKSRTSLLTDKSRSPSNSRKQFGSKSASSSRSDSLRLDDEVKIDTEETNASFENVQPEDDAPSESVPIPIRRRRPLRTRLPIPDSKDSAPSFPLLSTITTSSPPNSSSIRKFTTSTTEPTTPTTVSTTSSQKIRTPSSKISSNNSASADTLSNATSSGERRVHDFFRMNRARTRTTVSTSSKTTEPPFRYNSSKFHSRTTTSTSAVPTTSTQSNADVALDRTSTSPSTESVSSSPISKTPADVVLAGLSDVMRDVTSGDKDKYSQITTNLDALNKQLAERGILIIHAEIEGKIIKLRNITRNQNYTLLDSTLLGSSERSASGDANEQESDAPQSLTNSEEVTSAPSDRLDDIDIVLEKGKVNQENESLPSTHYDVQNKENRSDNINEVSSTKLNRNPTLSTRQPDSGDKRLSAETSSDSEDIPDHESSGSEALETTSKRRVIEVSTSKTPASFTGSGRTITQTRTTAAPLGGSDEENIEKQSSFEASSNDSGSSQESNDDLFTFTKPTSHLRPVLDAKITAEVIAEPSSRNDSDKPLEEEVLLIEEVILEGTNEDTSNYPLNDLVEPVESEGGSSVYIVGMVGILPLAVVAAYIVRKFLRGDSHKKALPESEERPDGFTPPTHHHPRTPSFLPVSVHFHSTNAIF